MNLAQFQGFNVLYWQAELRVHFGKHPGCAQYETDPCCVRAHGQKLV